MCTRGCSRLALGTVMSVGMGIRVRGVLRGRCLTGRWRHASVPKENSCHFTMNDARNALITVMFAVGRVLVRSAGNPMNWIIMGRVRSVRTILFITQKPNYADSAWWKMDAALNQSAKKECFSRMIRRVARTVAKTVYLAKSPSIVISVGVALFTIGIW